MKKLLLLSLMLISLYGCREKEQDPTVLPPATQEGKNTGGALVNGEVWVARIEYDTRFNNYNYSNTSHRLKIFLREYNGNDHLSIYIDDEYNHIEEGSYALNNTSINRGLFAKSSSFEETYYTNSENVGTLTITKFDRNKNIASGTFEFDAVNVNGEIVHITQGRFDKKFAQ